jgi:hypothetical protein
MVLWITLETNGDLDHRMNYYGVVDHIVWTYCVVDHGMNLWYGG